LYNLGNALQEIGQLDAALNCFTQVTELRPDHADAWINRGRLIDDKGRHEEAIACYDTALKLVPEDAIAWSNRGNSLKALGKLHDAVESYRQALNIDVRDFASLAGVAECMIALNELDKALAWLDTAIRANDQPHFHCEKSRVLMKLGRREEALAAIDQCIAMGVRSPQPYNNRGEILGKMERLEESLASFDEALRLQPDYLPAIFGKARVLVYHKRHAEARPLLERYFSLAGPDHDLHAAALALAGLTGMGKGGTPPSEN
jgi:tetratricopeptide (TPR) repeat protein